MSKRIAIVGGGISGLAAAHNLIGSGHQILLLESSDRFGGKLASTTIDGFLVEGGADSVVASRPRIVALCDELGLSNDLIPPADPARRAFIYRGGALYPIPEGFTGLVPGRWRPMLTTKLMSPLGKLRLLAELRIPVNTSREDESLESFVVRRFGAEAYARLLEPLLAGISSSEGNVLSLIASFPQWKTAELEYGSVIRGITAARGGKTDRPRMSGFLSLNKGMSQLPAALVSRLEASGAELLTGTRVTAIRSHGNGYVLATASGQRIDVDGVIVAVPGSEAAAMLNSVEPKASAALRDIPQRSSGLVSLGFNRPSVAAKLVGTGYLVPTAESRAVGGTTWSSSKWAGRAPEGSALIRFYFGRGKGLNLIEGDDIALIEAAKTELRETMKVTDEPDLVRVHRWINSVPQYTIGHLDRVSQIEQSLASHPGLALAGNMLRGVGIPICVQSGEAAAFDVLDALKSA